MKDVLLTLSAETAQKSDEEKLTLLDQEVADFEKFMTSNQVDWKVRGALLPQERVMLKTYLVQKLRGRVDG